MNLCRRCLVNYTLSELCVGCTDEQRREDLAATGQTCGFPRQDYHREGALEPCGDPKVVDTLEIGVPDRGTLVVPVCEMCYYRSMRLYPRDVVELVKNNQLKGEWRK